MRIRSKMKNSVAVISLSVTAVSVLLVWRQNEKQFNLSGYFLQLSPDKKLIFGLPVEGNQVASLLSSDSFAEMGEIQGTDNTRGLCWSADSGSVYAVTVSPSVTGRSIIACSVKSTKQDVILAFPTTEDVGSLSASPDGTWLGYHLADHSGIKQKYSNYKTVVHLYNLKNKLDVSIQSYPIPMFGVSKIQWSSDGKTFCFSAADPLLPNKSSAHGLVVGNVDNPTVLTFIRRSVDYYELSPDGQRIALRSGIDRRGISQSLLVIGTNGQEMLRVKSPEIAPDFKWSVDGKSIFVVNHLFSHPQIDQIDAMSGAVDQILKPNGKTPIEIFGNSESKLFYFSQKKESSEISLKYVQIKP